MSCGFCCCCASGPTTDIQSSSLFILSSTITSSSSVSSPRVSPSYRIPPSSHLLLVTLDQRRRLRRMRRRRCWASAAQTASSSSDYFFMPFSELPFMEIYESDFLDVIAAAGWTERRDVYLSSNRKLTITGREFKHHFNRLSPEEPLLSLFPSVASPFSDERPKKDVKRCEGSERFDSRWGRSGSPPPAGGRGRAAGSGSRDREGSVTSSATSWRSGTGFPGALPGCSAPWSQVTRPDEQCMARAIIWVNAV